MQPGSLNSLWGFDAVQSKLGCLTWRPQSDSLLHQFQSHQVQRLAVNYIGFGDCPAIVRPDFHLDYQPPATTILWKKIASEGSKGKLTLHAYIYTSISSFTFLPHSYLCRWISLILESTRRQER